MRSTRTALVLRLAIIALPLGTFSCSGGAGASAPAPPGGGRGGVAGPVPVTVATVERKSVPVEIRVIGTAEAYSTVSVHSQVTGQLEAVRFKEGDDVAKGQELFVLDRRPLETALQQAQANLERDIAQAANATAQAKRYGDLAERGIATREQVDTSKSASVASDATVAADRAAVENAKVQLEYATIEAPIAGRTGALQVHEGNLVRANDTVPLVVINQVSPIYVSFAIPESQLPELKRYMAQGSLEVQAAPPNDNGASATGTISFVDNTVDQTTGTIRIKGTFANEARRLWPGQFVNVRVTLTRDPNAIVVPPAAVQAGQQGSYAFVVKADKTVELRPLEVARTGPSEIVIQSGLQPGETVVTDGHLRLVAGSRVSVKGEDSQKVTP
jgi:multidrug efflux system membrane fusion protein